MDWERVGKDEDFEAAYTALQRVASRYLRSSQPLTLQTTSLVHEAYLKLATRSNVTLRGTGHARALMARAMRQVLVDHIRGRGTAKRNPGIRIALEQIESGDVGQESETSAVEIELVHRTLERLEEHEPESARLLELAYFGGYRQHELGEILGVSDRTVRTRLLEAQKAFRRILGDIE